MPSPRKLLARRINPDRKHRGRLSKYERLCIVQLLLDGEKISVVANRFECHRNTISNIFKRYKEANTLQPKPQSGPPPKLNRRERRAVFRLVRREPTIPWATLIEWCETRFGKKISRNTLRRILRSTNLGHWKSLKTISSDRRRA